MFLYSSINSFFVFKVSHHFFHYFYDILMWRLNFHQNPNCLTSSFLLTLPAISVIRFLLLILQSKAELWTELESKSYLLQNMKIYRIIVSFMSFIFTFSFIYPRFFYKATTCNLQSSHVVKVCELYWSEVLIITTFVII